MCNVSYSSRLPYIYAASEFVFSEYADAQLYFRHVRMEEDLKCRPDWKANISEDPALRNLKTDQLLQRCEGEDGDVVIDASRNLSEYSRNSGGRKKPDRLQSGDSFKSSASSASPFKWMKSPRERTTPPASPTGDGKTKFHTPEGAEPQSVEFVDARQEHTGDRNKREVSLLASGASGVPKKRSSFFCCGTGQRKKAPAAKGTT